MEYSPLKFKVGDFVKATKAGGVVVGRIVGFKHKKYKGAPQLVALQDLKSIPSFSVMEERCTRITKEEYNRINKRWSNLTSEI